MSAWDSVLVVAVCATVWDPYDYKGGGQRGVVQKTAAVVSQDLDGGAASV